MNIHLRHIIGFFSIILLIGVIGVTTYLVQQRQDPRGRAAFEGLSYRIPTQLFVGTLTSELGVEGNGNVYAPEVHYENGKYRMWYGGQNRNSGPDAAKDRIHYAESTDGLNWTKLGIVLAYANPAAINNGNPSNHINDPTIVKVNGTYYMYYTDAWTAEDDRISMATSTDGRNWTKVKMIIDGKSHAYSNKKVGRPTVLYDPTEPTAFKWKMWYDAICNGNAAYGGHCDTNRQYLPTERYITFAHSTNGYDWAQNPTPLRQINGLWVQGGAIDIKKVGDSFIIVGETRYGTLLIRSTDELTEWSYSHPYPTVWIPKSGQSFDQFGHITPFLFIPPDIASPPVVYFGGARNTYWSSNVIGATKISYNDLIPYTNLDPQGNFDQANCQILAGYACDMNAGDGPIEVHIDDGSTVVTAVTTTYDRKSDSFYTGPGGQSSQQIEQQLSRQCSPTGNVNKIIGWKIATPNSLKDDKPHTLHAYAINTPAGTKKKLTYYHSPTDYASTIPYTITCAAPPTPTPIPPTSTPTRTPTPTLTLTPTSTPIPPSSTPSPTATPTNTPIVTPVGPTSTPTPTRTPTPVPPTATATVTITPTNTPALHVGDTNSDGIVNIIDYNIVLNNFGRTGSGVAGAAVTEPLWKVDIYDYTLVLKNFAQ